MQTPEHFNSLSQFRNARNTPEEGVCLVPFAYSDGEALAIRSVLHDLALNHEARFFGRQDAVLAMLSNQDPAYGKYLVLCCHGDKDSNIMLWGDESLRPQDLAGKINLPGKVVIATGCSVGRQELATPFLDGGAAAYIAPAGDPEGGTGTIFCTLFFHALFYGKHTIQEAYERARGWDAETGLFRLWAA
ncbi:MAG: hypothetical protein JO316_06285 [Abitibacteriaceae bacterium]|nr:hypothetical protein [Abditibacteriaceae bacterium]